MANEQYFEQCIRPREQRKQNKKPVDRKCMVDRTSATHVFLSQHSKVGPELFVLGGQEVLGAAASRTPPLELFLGREQLKMQCLPLFVRLHQLGTTRLRNGRGQWVRTRVWAEGNGWNAGTGAARPRSDITSGCTPDLLFGGHSQNRSFQR